MDRYQSYKSSDIEWIGEIPSKWKRTKIKYHFDLISGFPFDSDNITIEINEYPIIRIGNVTNGEVNVYFNGLYSEKYPKVQKGDYIVSLTGDFSIRRWENQVSLLNQRCGLIKVNESYEIRFLFYFLPLQFRILEKTKYFTTLKNLSNSEFLNIEILLPPFTEQHQIVQFLDEKTELIDKLISTKERKINLLKEQRTTLINQVVTKGLNPNVKMKDSGVEWIGNIPEHWISKKLKHIFKYKKGYPFKSDDMGDEGTPIIKVTDIKNLTINKPKDYFTKGIDNRITRVKENDIIITTVGSKMEVSNSSVGQLGLVGIEQDGFLLNQNTLCIRLKGKDNNIKFVFYLLQSNRFRGHLDIHSHGTVNQSSLNVEDVLNYTIIVSDLNEQTQIVEHLDSKTKEIDDLVQLEQKKIDLLKEYRQSLISEVVTGKVKVTN